MLLLLLNLSHAFMDKHICRSPDLTFILVDWKRLIKPVFIYTPAPVRLKNVPLSLLPSNRQFFLTCRATKFSLAFYQLDYPVYLSHVFPRLCGQEMIIRSCSLRTIRQGTIIRDSKIASFSPAIQFFGLWYRRQAWSRSVIIELILHGISCIVWASRESVYLS